MNGSEFVKALPPTVTDGWILEVMRAIRDGHVVHDWADVHVAHGRHRGVVRVSRAALRVGRPGDSVRVMGTAAMAQVIGHMLGACLMTPAVMDKLYEQATVRVAPQTQWPCLFTTAAMIRHHDELEAAVAGRSGLVDNEGKIFAATTRLANPQRLKMLRLLCAVYAWFAADGDFRSQTGQHPVYQPLSLAHNVWHGDYSMFLRYMLREMLVDGHPMDVVEVLRDPELCGLLSAEGVLENWHLEMFGPEANRPEDALAAQRAAEASGRTLTVGARGEDVANWQRFLNGRGAGLVVDGVFGGRTLKATIAFQQATGLVPDGAVGRMTRAMAEEKVRAATLPGWTPVSIPTVRGAQDEPKTSFVQAKHFRRGGPDRQVLWVQLHTMELGETLRTAESCAQYFATSPDGRQVSATYCLDADSVVQCVREEDIAYGSSSSNPLSVHFEHAGYARQSREDWADEYSEAMLRMSAALAARVCARWKIPVRFVDVEDVIRLEPGITTHAVITKAIAEVNRRKLVAHPLYGGHTTHSDPGPHFPMGHYVAMAMSVEQRMAGADG